MHQSRSRPAGVPSTDARPLGCHYHSLICQLAQHEACGCVQTTFCVSMCVYVCQWRVCRVSRCWKAGRLSSFPLCQQPEKSALIPGRASAVPAMPASTCNSCHVAAAFLFRTSPPRGLQACLHMQVCEVCVPSASAAASLLADTLSPAEWAVFRHVVGVHRLYMLIKPHSRRLAA